MADRCQEVVFSRGMFRGSACSRNAVRDGYCTQHHPDAREARAEKSAARYSEKSRIRDRGYLRSSLGAIALQMLGPVDDAALDDLIDRGATRFGAGDAARRAFVRALIERAAARVTDNDGSET